MKTLKPKIQTKLIKTIQVTDPDTGNEIKILIVKESGGAMFGIESDFILNTDEPAYSPYINSRQIETRDL